jgi:hydrogenase maturation protease
MTGRILVAGVGNVFLRDDAFGVEVIRLLAEHPQPPGVQIRDYGIRGVHLVYELLDGYELFVLVDAAPRGEAPGTVSVLEVELPSPDAQPVIDAHSLTPDAIFGLLSSLGGRPGRSLVVACEPAEVDAGMGLSDPVREALPHAVRAVEEILAQAMAAGPQADVRDADVRHAAVQEADMQEADMQEAEVQEAEVQEAADEQGCMADLTHPDRPSQEGGAQDAEQADQGSRHRGGAGTGGGFTA